jgi:hypothetical protein
LTSYIEAAVTLVDVLAISRYNLIDLCDGRRRNLDRLFPFLLHTSLVIVSLV